MRDRSTTLSWILAAALHAILLVWAVYTFEPLPPRPKPERLLAKTIVLDQEIIAMGEVLQPDPSPAPAPPPVEKMAEEETMVPKPEPAQPPKKELDEPQPPAPEPEPDPESLPNPEAMIPAEPEPVKKAPPEPKPEPKPVKPKPAEPKEKCKPKPKAPVTKAKPKKTEEKPKAKPKPAPKPKPKPDCKPKPKPVVKAPPPIEEKKPAINEKQKELLAKARQAAAKLESSDLKKVIGQAVKPKKLGVLNIENAGPPGYQRALVSKLQDLLILPEFGDVKLKLTLARSGKVVKIEILSAKSTRNQSYIEENLKRATMPAFGDNFAGSNQETFTLTLKGE